MEDDFSKLKKPYASLPDHITRAIESPREVPSSIGIMTKQRNKDVLTKLFSSGQIEQGAPIRFTSVDELNSIFTTGKLRDADLLRKHLDAEGRVGVSAQLVKNNVMMAYGPNTKISAAIVFPKDSVEGKGMGPNEVKINPNMDVKKLKYVIGGHDELLSHEAVAEVIRRNRPNSVKPVSFSNISATLDLGDLSSAKMLDIGDSINLSSQEAARRVIPEPMALNITNSISRSGSANIIASEATGGTQRGMTKAAGNSKVITELLKNTLKKGI